MAQIGVKSDLRMMSLFTIKLQNVILQSWEGNIIDIYQDTSIDVLNFLNDDFKCSTTYPIREAIGVARGPLSKTFLWVAFLGIFDTYIVEFLFIAFVTSISNEFAAIKS